MTRLKLKRWVRTLEKTLFLLLSVLGWREPRKRQGFRGEAEDHPDQTFLTSSLRNPWKSTGRWAYTLGFSIDVGMDGVETEEDGGYRGWRRAWFWWRWNHGIWSVMSYEELNANKNDDEIFRAFHLKKISEVWRPFPKLFSDLDCAWYLRCVSLMVPSSLGW